jgi:energy-coupling factor transporter ATP-binding protein EcfA2
MLSYLDLVGVGPADEMKVDFAPRLNIFTGDNGLGKTFLLDIAWWALTATWADKPALPQLSRKFEPTISFRFEDTKFVSLQDSGYDGDREDWKRLDLSTSNYNNKRQTWSKVDFKNLLPELMIYVQANGDFMAFDKSRIQNNPERKYHFTSTELWDGLRTGQTKTSRVLCNGLIQDFVNWQRQSDQTKFRLLLKVIQCLFHPNDTVEVAEPRRISLKDIREIPILRLPYGEIPITHLSSGMKRVLGLAYLLVWHWDQHIQTCEITGESPSNQLILLIDEPESHLHPQWQRTILPALFKAVELLKNKINIQVLATTHSPLVLASLESTFTEKQDKFFLFELEENQVHLKEMIWTKFGDVIGWLTSDVFGLKQARSAESEEVIGAAYAFMRNPKELHNSPEHLRTKEQIHQELLKVLPGDDPFWPRWVVRSGIILK